jgi:hypothetical protein
MASGSICSLTLPPSVDLKGLPERLNTFFVVIPCALRFTIKNKLCAMLHALCAMRAFELANFFIDDNRMLSTILAVKLVF